MIERTLLALRSHVFVQVFRSRVPLKVVAARVGGVEIPNNKHVEYSLRYIYGIGPTTAKALVAEVPVSSLPPPRLQRGAPQQHIHHRVLNLGMP